MRVYVLSALLVVSFIASIVTAAMLNWLTVVSLAVFATTVTYIDAHKKELESDLDKLFGRDERM